jgi:hypothetical protein
MVIRQNSARVMNLVVNSKYGKFKGSTEVRVEDLTDEKVIVRVTDNEKELRKNIPRLFERFIEWIKAVQEPRWIWSRFV